MSKLKEKLTEAVKRAKSLKPGDDMWDDMFYVTKLKQDVDSIIDAVIEVLPSKNIASFKDEAMRNDEFHLDDQRAADMAFGHQWATDEIKLILEEAKSNSN